MKAITLDADGASRWEEVAAPVCGPEDVRIAVRAAGVNRADLLQRAGHYPPPPGASDVLGLEVTGTVTEVGADVSDWAVGDRVGALLPGGGYAGEVCAHHGSLLRLPDEMSFTDGCAFPEALFTVWANVFVRGGFTAGERFLCHGGTSGIGVIALQAARFVGSERIFATAGTDAKVALAGTLGADRAIHYREEAFETVVADEGGADVILGMVGGDYVQRNIACARPDGRIVNIAYQNGLRTEVDFLPVLLKRLTLTATTLRARTSAQKQALRDGLRETLWPGVVSGAIRPVIDSVHDIADVDAAHARMRSGEHAGKIVLAMG